MDDAGADAAVNNRLAESEKGHWMNRRIVLCLTSILLAGLLPRAIAHEPIHIGFLWHMHQPIYYPYESLIETDAQGRFSFSVVNVHNQRFGPYTTWPFDAITVGSGLPHLGAQVSFSGSLIENLNNLEDAGVFGGAWNNWDWGYDWGVSLDTALDHPRLDLVAFGYHHPLMPLLDAQDIRMQIRLHKHIYAQTWTGGPLYSSGMFPAETAFATRMIPALAAEGIQWVLVDNIHFDRACTGYPHTNDAGLFAPNPADQINPDPAATGGAWVQLNDLWAPSRVSVPFGYQPHYAQYVDPATGEITRIIVVPAARYEGNEDGRGGYGAFLYDQVMDQYIGYNTDPQHPMFVVLHHDGDNHGGGSEAYYHSNFQNMVAWVGGDPDYDVSTVADYLVRFPPDPNDVIHVEDGAWAGADGGDPEFRKWLGDPAPNGWSPDRNSWAVLTAAKNRVFTAHALSPAPNLQDVLDGTGSASERAWHYLLCAEASDYWYWDGTEIWDSNVTRACNLAVAEADLVLAGEADTTPPTVFLPQREPYNPGGFEWGSEPMPTNFEVWTFAYDVSGLQSVTLRWRIDDDGVNPLDSIQNETYAGGPEVGAWNDVAMTSSDVAPPPGILIPTYRALRYGAMIAEQQDVLIDYYVEALDTEGNLQRSPVQHVYVGTGGGSGGDAVTVEPDPAPAGADVTITYDPAGRILQDATEVYLHYGFNNWNPVVSPDPVMNWDAGNEVWQITVPVPSTATQLDFVFNDGAGNWDNNNGADWHVDVVGGGPGDDWVMDGELDAAATLVASNGELALYAGFANGTLYVAGPDAGEGNDHFIFVSAQPGSLWSAPWAKAGQVASWACFLANENNNLWSGWQETSASNASATGGGSGWLEGTLSLPEEFDTVPDHIYLAFAAFGTADGAPLVVAGQIPASADGDGNVDADEYMVFPLATVCRGDCNCDGAVNWRDIDYFVAGMNDNVSAWQAMFAPDEPGCAFANCDVNEDGGVNWRDIDPFVSVMNTTCWGSGDKVRR